MFNYIYICFKQLIYIYIVSFVGDESTSHDVYRPRQELISFLMRTMRSAEGRPEEVQPGDLQGLLQICIQEGD